VLGVDGATVSSISFIGLSLTDIKSQFGAAPFISPYPLAPIIPAHLVP